jgi:hypothetical protein
MSQSVRQQRDDGNAAASSQQPGGRPMADCLAMLGAGPSRLLGDSVLRFSFLLHSYSEHPSSPLKKKEQTPITEGQ